MQTTDKTTLLTRFYLERFIPTNMVRFDEARQLMDEMMKVTIFQPSEKRRMLEDERRTFLDPNLIMDARHKIFRENLCKSPAKSSVLAEARKLLTQEETRELQLRKEQALVERELRKFEQDLQRSRPKFSEPYACSRKNIASSDDEDFWRTSSRVKALVNKREKGKTNERRMTVLAGRKTKRAIAAEVPESEDYTGLRPINEIEGASFGNIKVTIKDKLSCESEGKEERSRFNLKSCFEALRENARRKQRLREIGTNVRSIATRGNLRRCVRVWRARVENAKKRTVTETSTSNIEVRKIDALVETIVETQKCLLTKHRGAEPRRGAASASGGTEARRKQRTTPVVESPAQSRLSAQREIIREQRLKLAEQSRLIEELRLRQVQEEITRAGVQTVNAAKETLTHCGQRTRRTLIQLMRQAGYRDKSLTAPLRVSSPPRFLMRMEARAEARRSRIKLREEARQSRLEDERRRQEAAMREEERERRRSQQEVLREARRMREEREQQRARETERYKQLNAVAEAFYRKHLLRRYIMGPFVALVETKNNRAKRADDHYERRLLRRAFVGWKMEAERQAQIKRELATSLYNGNLLWWALRGWREVMKEERRKEQVAKDFCDMKLQGGYFRLWKIKTVEYKTERLRNERLASEHYERGLKIKYLGMWKRYPKIVPDIAASERMRDALREIVQEVVPDFDPRQRGVILED